MRRGIRFFSSIQVLFLIKNSLWDVKLYGAFSTALSNDANSNVSIGMDFAEKLCIFHNLVSLHNLSLAS